MNGKFKSRTFWSLVVLGGFFALMAWCHDWTAADCVLAFTLPVGAWMGGKYSQGREQRLNNGGIKP